MTPTELYTIRLVGTGAAILGVVAGTLSAFALLRRQSLLGDVLSHAALPGICIGFLVAGSRSLPAIVIGALVAGLIAALTLLLLERYSRTKVDAALGTVLSVFFAIGTVLLTYIQKQNDAGQSGLDSFLFGQAAAMLPADLWLMAVIGAVTLLSVGLFWKQIKLSVFDRDFAATNGVPVFLVDLMITMAMTMAVVVGLQMVGVVLMSAMLIAPAAAARQWSNRLGPMVLLSATFGAVAGVTGAVTSAMAEDLPTGPIMVLCASVIVVVSLMLAPQRGLVWSAIKRNSVRQNLRSRKVLLDLVQIAMRHDDLHYPFEIGMVGALYGKVAVADVLIRLQERGWLEPAEHMSHIEGQHWRLTVVGITEAQRAASEFGLDWEQLQQQAVR